jgi:hypothetical protein
MANYIPGVITFSKSGNTYTIRGLTEEQALKIQNALTEHQDISGKLDVSLKGANNGLAELNSAGKVPDSQLPSYISSAEKGANSGVAELDASGKVPSSQLPSYVDDVEEYSGTTNFPQTGESGKIYVDTTTNKSYRWSGSTYTEICSYSNATQSADGLMSSQDKTKLDGVTAGAEPNPGTVTQSTDGLMSSEDKTKLDGITAGAQPNPGNATQSTDGLMSSADKTKLDGIKIVYSESTAPSSPSEGMIWLKKKV